MGAAEDAETIGFNAAIRGGGERGAEHGEDGDGDGGNVHRRLLAPTPNLGRALHRHYLICPKGEVLL